MSTSQLLRDSYFDASQYSIVPPTLKIIIVLQPNCWEIFQRVYERWEHILQECRLHLSLLGLVSLQGRSTFPSVSHWGDVLLLTHPFHVVQPSLASRQGEHQPGAKSLAFCCNPLGIGIDWTAYLGERKPRITHWFVKPDLLEEWEKCWPGKAVTLRTKYMCVR